MGYFECNLPSTAPVWVVDADMRTQFERAADKVRKRTNVLSEALDIAAIISGATFVKYAKPLFRTVIGPERFDHLSPYELASTVLNVMWDGVDDPEVRVEFPNAIVLFDGAFATTEEWEVLRLIGLGGSDTDSYAGSEHFKTKRDTYFDKSGARKRAADPASQAIFDRGHDVEDRVIDTFCENTGATRTYETRMFQSKDCPYLTANPDDVLIMDTGELVLFEAKSTVTANRDNWKDDAPYWYRLQTYAYMSVLDDERIKRAFVGCLFLHDTTIMGRYITAEYDKRQFISRIVQRDVPAEQRIVAKAKRFVETYLIPGVEPPVSGVAADQKVDERYPIPVEPDAPEMDFGTQLTNDLLELENVNRDIEAMKQRADLIKSRIKDAMGSSTRGRAELDENEFFVISYGERRKKGGIDAEKLEAFYPDAFAACKMPDSAGARTLLIKRKKILKAAK